MTFLFGSADVLVFSAPSHHHLFPELAFSWVVLVVQADRQSDRQTLGDSACIKY